MRRRRMNFDREFGDTSERDIRWGTEARSPFDEVRKQDVAGRYSMASPETIEARIERDWFG